MGRWTQYDGDSYRLPEGITRIAYDSDTQQYTFRDNNTGETFLGAPREYYGVMTPISSNSDSRMSQDSDTETSDPHLLVDVPVNPAAQAQSFSDFLPADLITSPSTAESTHSPPSSPSHSHESSGDRFRRVARTVGFPKMPGVVQNAMRRSGTLRRGKSDSRSLMSEKGLLDRADSISNEKGTLRL